MAAPSTAEWGTAAPGTAEWRTAEPGTAEWSTAEPSTAEASPDQASPDQASAGEASPDQASTADGLVHENDWFLRTGRAGLHPDSETSWDDPAADPPADHHEARVTPAGAPPWAGETTAVSASTPPPWETGPWPGPGGATSFADGVGDDQAAPPAAHKSAPPSLAGSHGASGAAFETTQAVAMPVRWPARTVLTAGLVPLVVPGLVLGFLSLRRPGGAAVRKASWLAIGASLAWAVIIIVIVVSVSGGSAAACNGYPASVHQAYEKALGDLRANAPASAQAADFERAASLANASAAATGQIGVRAALFTMANDMTEARADVVAGRPISATLQRHLADDARPPAGSCAS